MNIERGYLTISGAVPIISNGQRIGSRRVSHRIAWSDEGFTHQGRLYAMQEPLELASMIGLSGEIFYTLQNLEGKVIATNRTASTAGLVARQYRNSWNG